MIQFLGILILFCSILFLLAIQYIMILSDIRNNNAELWEIIIGIIPLGPYILLILAAIWHIFTKITRSTK